MSIFDKLEKIDRAITAEELARLLCVSHVSVFRWAKSGRIPSFRIGTCVRFDPRAIADWLRKI
jgi:excisionase family DNA binding protein